MASNILINEMPNPRKNTILKGRTLKDTIPLAARANRDKKLNFDSPYFLSVTSKSISLVLRPKS